MSPLQEICSALKPTKVKRAATLLGLALLAPALASAQTQGRISGTEFNPAVSLILEGLYVDLDHEALEVPGFHIGGEAGLPEKGFSSGHNELNLSANVDDRFYGSLSAAIVEHDGETEVELEEAYMETLTLGAGLTFKAGKFFSGLGYLNGVHDHAHDFVDRPLLYDVLLGGHLVDSGAQLRWVAPTPMYLSVGLEMTRGSAFPGGENDGASGLGAFVKTGGDLGAEASWQLGLGLHRSEFDEREAGGHDHGDHDAEPAIGAHVTDGEAQVLALDFVYKWARHGDPGNVNFKLQAEYFVRDEDGDIRLEESEDKYSQAFYDGEQEGYYVQGVYQFAPGWRVGLRHERLQADNDFSRFSKGAMPFMHDGDDIADAAAVGAEAGLEVEKDPRRESLMLDYSPSHFSRIRLQYSRFENGHGETDDVLSLQFLMSLGSHGAHKF